MATWAIEARNPGAGAGWTTVTPVTAFKFHKEVNAIHSLDLTVISPPVAPEDGLVLYFNMETLDAGAMKDLSGTGNNGTMTGTSSVAGKYGSARNFNGTSDRIQATDGGFSSGGSPSSVSAWIKTSSSGSTLVIHEYGTVVANEARGIGLSATGLLFFTGHLDDATFTLLPAVNDGAWHFVAAVVNSSTSVTGYVDGKSQTMTLPASLNTILSGAVGVGSQPTGPILFNGSIDEFCIYNRALSSAEVNALMNASMGKILANGNEIRVRDSDAGKEWFRGRIRDVTVNQTTQEWSISALDNVVLLQDRKWTNGRTFPAVPANVVMDELVNSPEGEPSNGQVLRYNMETLTSDGKMADLSGNGGNGTITGATLVVGKWGLSESFGAVGNNIDTPHSTPLDLTGAWSLDAFIKTDVAIPNDAMNVYGICLLNKLSAGVGLKVSFGYTNTGFYVYPYVYVEHNGASAVFNLTPFADPLGTIQLGWFHLYVQYDGATTITAILSVWDTATHAIANPPGHNVVDVVVGGNPSGMTFHQFRLDEYYLFNRTLSSDERALLCGTKIFGGGMGTIDTFTAVSFRAEQDDRLSCLDSLARAVAGEWYVDRDGSDRDRLNLVSRIGSVSPTDTFKLGVDAILQNQKVDTETMVNDLTCLGKGTGALQLQSRNFYGTTIRTTLTADYAAGSTGSLTVTDTSLFPTSGTVYVGMERIDYSGKDATHLGTVSVTRAYAADFYASLAAYTHPSGLEVYLHRDTTTSPPTYYTADIPQAGSRIRVYGWKQDTYIDQSYADQSALDRLVQRLVGKFKDPRESVVVNCPRSTVLCDLGDNVTVQNMDGSTYKNSPYRVFVLEFSYPDHTWHLELNNYRDTFDRRAQDSSNTLQNSVLYGQQAVGAKGVIVGAGLTSKAVTFAAQEKDANYSVNAMTSWGTTLYVTAKTVNGFTLNFGTAAPGGGGTFDWQIYRS